LLPAPEEQHTFGLVVVSELFRRNGWHVQGVAPMELDELQDLVSEQWFVLIGFSLSCDRLINPLCSTIQTVRRVSKNKSVQIMVGGRAFAKDPALWPEVGADWTASNAQEALELAETMADRGKLRRDSTLI
jgi:methanogenic corrinoid protein MtbC1